MLRKLILSLSIADNIVSNIARKPFGSKWVLTGKCRKCGKCCRQIHLKIEPRLLNNWFTFKVVTMWISWLFCFKLLSVDRERHYLVFGCKNLCKSGKCSVYKWRPGVCRNYPLVDFFERPELFRGCGYKAGLR